MLNLLNKSDRHLALDALHMALRRQKPLLGALFHFDRGSPYVCCEFQRQLVAYGFTPSMSRSGYCYDHTPMESFFLTLKTELEHDENFATRAEAKKDYFCAK
jgi:putative transposase